MDLENPYETMERMVMWEVLMMDGVGGEILISIKSMCEESMVCEEYF
jgi:hypothetical protein